MANLITTHIVEVPMSIISINELVAPMNDHLSMRCQIQVQSNAGIGLALPIYF
jgi:hypothetical protein